MQLHIATYLQEKMAYLSNDKPVEMTIWQLVRLAIFDNELWTDYATLVCSHACDILSLNCLLVILLCYSTVCRCLLFVSLFRNTRFISQCDVCLTKDLITSTGYGPSSRFHCVNKETNFVAVCSGL